MDGSKCSLNETEARYQAEKGLLRCLLRDYEKDVRPVMKPTDVVNVTIDMVLLQLVSLVGNTVKVIK